MKPRTLLVTASLGLLIALLCAPRVCRCQDEISDATKAEARDRFDRGLKLFNQGDNAAALAEFQRAYELTHNAAVLYNVGLVYAAMSRPVEAVDALDRAMATGKVSGERLARAKQVRVEMAERVAEVEVATNVPATVDLDTVEVGKTPLAAPIKVASGTRVIGAVAEGYAPVHREITVAGRTLTKVVLDLVAVGPHPVPVAALRAEVTGPPETLAAEPSSPPPPGAKQVERDRTWAWVTFVSGGVLMVGGGAYYLVNLSKQHDAQSSFDAATNLVNGRLGVCHASGQSFDRAACEAQYASAWDDLSAAKNRGTAALVVTGAGAAAIGIGAYALLATSHVHVTPTVGLGSIAITGQF